MTLPNDDMNWRDRATLSVDHFAADEADWRLRFGWAMRMGQGELRSVGSRQ